MSQILRALACVTGVGWGVLACGGGEVSRPPPSQALAAPLVAPTIAPSEAPTATQVTTAADDSAHAPIDISDRLFQLVSSQGYAPVAGTKVQVGFRDGAVMFFADCNQCGGEYSVCNSRLCVTSLMCTQRGCPAELGAQDEWLVAFLGAKPRITPSENGLTLRGEQATLEFLSRDLADPDRPLMGSVWSITEFVDDLGRWSFALNAAPTIEFHDDGSFQFRTGCGEGAGHYVVTGSRLTLSEVKYDARPCPTDNDERASRYVVAVLKDGIINFEVRAAHLRMARGELELGGETK